jgi:hypothetical protein
MRGIATRYRVNFSTVVLAAVVQVNLRVRGKCQLVVEVERDLRQAVPELDTSRTLGAFADIYTTVVPTDVRPGTGGFLRWLNKQIATASGEDAQADLAFRFFGEMNGTLLRPMSLHGSTHGDGGGAAASRVDAWVRHDELQLCWRSEIGTNAVQELPYLLRASMCFGANDKVDFFPADFPLARTSQQDLDVLLSQVLSRGEQ